MSKKGKRPGVLLSDVVMSTIQSGQKFSSMEELADSVNKCLVDSNKTPYHYVSFYNAVRKLQDQDLLIAIRRVGSKKLDLVITESGRSWKPLGAKPPKALSRIRLNRTRTTIPRSIRLERRLRVLEQSVADLTSRVSEGFLSVSESLGQVDEKLHLLVCHDCQKVQQTANEARKLALEAKDRYENQIRQSVAKVYKGDTAVHVTARD